MNPLERPLNLYLALSSATRPLTRNEIYEQVLGYPAEDKPDARRKAFERDKACLKKCNVVIVNEEEFDATGQSKIGYRVDNKATTFNFSDLNLTPEEMLQFSLAMAVVKFRDNDYINDDYINNNSINTALLKSGGKVMEQKSSMEVYITQPDEDNFNIITEAARNCHPVSFLYKDKQRHLYPYNCQFMHKRLNIVAYDVDDDMVKNYRFDRIASKVEIDRKTTFEKPQDKPISFLQPWQYGEEPLTKVTVLFDADQMGIFESDQEKVNNLKVVEILSDGSIKVEYEVNRKEAFFSYLFNFLDKVEILSPPDYREAMVDYLQAVINYYS